MWTSYRATLEELGGLKRSQVWLQQMSESGTKKDD